ncbi:MAG TPA: phenylalanine--tRNA ligase subunit beta [Chthonomonadales bacterium]|nr:phenylalanine--tRNA ligase subunit beta [Chthonomonadales bacterium]
MRLPVEWIVEMAPTGDTADELARRLTMAGLEVEETAESNIGPVLSIKVTPNRGDCLSVVGVARDLGALTGVSLRLPSFARSAGPGEMEDWSGVTIEDPDLCPRYAARLVRDIRPGESPRWMQDRLLAAGMRPVSNVVDVTNYVMIETGQPLHAFDYERLAEGRIVVRRARPGESIVSLDGVQRELSPEMLLICDAKKPIAIAGVMGGTDAEMRSSTTVMLLESAHFLWTSIRRTARALGMTTEASYRFERIVDPAGVVAAADRACALIEELGFGKPVEGVLDEYPGAAPRRRLSVRPARCSAMLGFPVTESDVRTALARLGFDETESGVSIEFAVPSFRPDVVREIDLVEEVGRVLGYDRIPERLPEGATTQGRDTDLSTRMGCARRLLVGCGLQEVVGHSLLASNELDRPIAAGDRVAIRSALSADLAGLRASLLPGLVDVLDRNARRGHGRLAAFEIGRVFRRTEAGYDESVNVAGAIAGPMVGSGWARDTRWRSTDFHTAAGVVERLVRGLGAPSPSLAPGDDPRLHPGRQAWITVAGSRVGLLGELHPQRAADLHIRSRVLVFELALEALPDAQPPAALTPLSPYPPVVRDLAPRIALTVPYESVRRAVEDARPDTLESFELTDVFDGAPLPEGVRSLTLSFTFRAPDRTLADAEVADALAALRAALAERCGATFAV